MSPSKLKKKNEQTEKFAIWFPEDLLAWCKARAQQQRVPTAIFIRSVLFAAMDADRTAKANT